MALAPAAGFRRAGGFALGALAGPFGIGWLWWRGRSGSSIEGLGRREAGRNSSGGNESMISL